MNPKIIIFNAVSLDGATTGFPVDHETYYGLVSEINEDVTLAGCDTLLAATPAETTTSAPRSEEKNTDEPRRTLAVVDARGRLKAWRYWKAQRFWNHWVYLGTPSTPKEHADMIRQENIESFLSGGDHVDLADSVRHLATEYGARTIRLESGGALNGAMLSAGLVSEIHLLVHPVLVGQSGTRFTGGFSNNDTISLTQIESHNFAGGRQFITFEVASKL